MNLNGVQFADRHMLQLQIISSLLFYIMGVNITIEISDIAVQGSTADFE